ncbi:unnamed protein product [Leptosia nina]|uniref:Uncharacterized protein n=1 Tax=Leptosia nina TaxID=320188 RepID=A0AAV1JB29_9NEOP
MTLVWSELAQSFASTLIFCLYLAQPREYGRNEFVSRPIVLRAPAQAPLPTAPSPCSNGAGKEVSAQN